ncbi:hypothetical protein BHE74_00057168 [Ensete ventricosum]|nr:hypothetical protein BHE74_00057168 [Ensete ventricosum]RZS14909.1 hypothetical protein BHM03_00046668 [Ensete ventricosum]
MSGGDNVSGRKAYSHAVVEKCPRQTDEPEITFEARDAEYPDHDDALLVSIRIANARVRRVMVDTGSLVDVLYFDTIQKLRLTTVNLSPMSSTLNGFIELPCRPSDRPPINPQEAIETPHRLEPMEWVLEVPLTNVDLTGS